MEMFDCIKNLWDKPDFEPPAEEVDDPEARNNLSHVGKAAYETLRKEHSRYHQQLWNVTSGTVIGELHQTPRDAWERETEYPRRGHDDWLPMKMGEIISRTEVWCDIMSLAPPDGLFMDHVKNALKVVAKKSVGKHKPVIVRMMFGSIPAVPVNCNKLIKEFTQDFPNDANVHLWVGAWRRGASWNHAKLIAVDGKFLHTGGHNMWTRHYLIEKPVHDLSLELKGDVAHDGHRFANQEWAFIKYKQDTVCGRLVDQLPDNIILMAKTRVVISEYPEGRAPEFAPLYHKGVVPATQHGRDDARVPIITMGRYGTILRHERPSDDAIVAMLGSARKVIHLALQDLGPVCAPHTKIPLPGCVWPKKYLSTIARVMFEHGVDVEIALSNPGSIPGDCSAVEANYGNGWTCADVAAEVIKQLRKQFPEADDGSVRKIVTENLRVCFIRQRRGNHYDDGASMGMHAKHFIVDDICCYIGSQNLYICDLAEWGIVIDHEEQTKKLMDQYWNPMWQSSFKNVDCDVDEVLNKIDEDRDTDATAHPEINIEDTEANQAHGVVSSKFLESDES